MRLSRTGMATPVQRPDDVGGVVLRCYRLPVTWLVGLFLAVLPSFAVNAADTPVLPKRAASVASFAPPGWIIEQQLSKDFNRDGRADALVLLRPAPMTAKSGQPDASGVAGATSVPGDSSAAVRLSAPRMLAVLLGTRSGYELSASNGRLVPQVDLASQEDPMADAELTVTPGGFDIKLGMTAGVGSYLGTALRYRFRRQDGCFRLIGYDRLETHRATLATQDLSVNFLTGAVVHTTGNAQSDATQVRRERLSANPRRCFQELDSAVDFRPL